MSRILVTPEMLLHVAVQCSRAHEQLEANIHMLNQNIHMLESGWEGTTRSRFYADFKQAHREMILTTEHIQRTSLELRGIAQRFKSADERVQPIHIAGHVLGAYPMMRGPAGHSAVEDAGRKAEEAWNSVQQEAGKAWDTVKQEAGELWEGVKIGATQLGNSLKDTAISLYEDPLGTGKEMLYNATIGTVEDIHGTMVWAGRMLFSDEYREKIAEDVKAEVDSAGGWSKYLGQGAALILGEAILNRAGIRGRGPLNKKHDDLGGGNSGGNGSSDGGERGDDVDGKKSGNEGTGDAPRNEISEQVSDAEKLQRPYHHLVNVDGLKRGGRPGISGGHNMDNFYTALQEDARQYGLSVEKDYIIGEPKKHPIEGIYEVEYQIPSLQRTEKDKSIFEPIKDPEGNVVGKRVNDPKTVYDPNIISNEKMYKWGKAALEPQIQAENEKNGIVKGELDGLKFIGFVDENGKIKNFYPTFDYKD
ncbi:WXG100 family type VII secretion target [Virgibacillus sp. LDC1]|nr:WXG100 family type VII secretion target [Virgibacillus sp. LDC1]